MKESAQLSPFPAMNAVLRRTLACLASVFEMGTGISRPL